MNDKLIKIAKIISAHNTVFQRLNKEQVVYWDDLPDDAQNNVIKGVSFVINNPNVTPEQCHDNWRKGLEEEGWTLAEDGVKDLDNKRHPLLVPYSELSDADQAKDESFITLVKLLNAVII